MTKRKGTAICIQVPKKGKFTKGNKYKASRIFYGFAAYDENDELQTLSITKTHSKK